MGTTHKLIGICGGIGSGKSVISRVLRLRGEAVYDCDLEGRRIMDTSEEVLRLLHERYGEVVCPARGPICRPNLARKIFGNDEERLWLNALVHRMVREDVKTWSEAMSRKGHPRCFVESAILVTSGLAAMCSEIIIVDAPEQLRISRVRDRDGLDEESILRRIRSQEEEERMVRKSGCTVVTVCNDGEASVLESLGTHEMLYY